MGVLTMIGDYRIEKMVVFFKDLLHWHDVLTPDSGHIVWNEVPLVLLSLSSYPMWPSVIAGLTNGFLNVWV